MTPELDTFQHETLAFLDAAHGRAVIADPMGARKTGTTCAWLAQTGVGRTLVVAPSSVHGHWEREVGRFFPAARVWRASGKQARLDAIEDVATCSADYAGVYITSYESAKINQHQLVKARFDAVVFDEGHRLKGRTTQVALTANALAHSPYLIICTGTPVLNHAAELWQYLHMMAPGEYPAFWRWADENFKIEERRFRGARWPTKIIHGYRPGREDVVRNQIMPWFIQRDIAELFPNAPWVVEPEHVEIAVDLSAGERREYDRLVKFKWADIDGVEVTTANSVALTTRLTQLQSEWGTLGAEEVGTKVKTTIELVMDLLERDEPVVVFAKYQGSVDRIVEGLRAKHVTALAYHGGIDAHDRDVAVTQFGNGKCWVLVGTLDSLSEGVDGLQERSATIVMHDRHWTAAKNDQAFGRLRRSGQVRKVTVYHVFANDTIDATITDACLRKTNVVQSLNGKPLKTLIYGRTS